MYPVIFDFGLVDIFGFEFHLAIYSFGLMLVLAFYTCFFLLNNDLKRMGYDENLASDIIFWSAVGGIAGAKIYHILENLNDILSSSNPLGQIFSGSGLVFLGGLIGAIIAVTFILKKYNVPWLEFADRLAPLIMLGYAIGRVGCFLVGDDYGLPSELPWALSFPKGLPPTTITSFQYHFPWIDVTNLHHELIRVHPTQLYETIICLTLFYFLWRSREKVIKKGNLFFSYLILAGTERFLVEFIRTQEKYLLDLLSGAQIISITMICTGSYFLLKPVKTSEINKS